MQGARTHMFCLRRILQTQVAKKARHLEPRVSLATRSHEREHPAGRTE